MASVMSLPAVPLDRQSMSCGKGAPVSARLSMPAQRSYGLRCRPEEGAPVSARFSMPAQQPYSLRRQSEEVGLDITQYRPDQHRRGSNDKRRSSKEVGLEGSNDKRRSSKEAIRSMPGLGSESSEDESVEHPRDTGNNTPSPTGKALAEAKIEGEVTLVPSGYVIQGAPKIKKTQYMPAYELWVTLKGGNGAWQQRKAMVIWEDLVKENKELEELERLQEAEMRRQRKLAAEAEKKRKEELEQYIANHEQRELERRLKFEEQQRLDAERDAEVERQRQEAARWLAKRQPRECPACQGSGRCPTCTGKGYVFHFYPASTCSMNLYPTASSSRTYGRVNGGCPACGGSGDETWSNYTPGLGRCKTCNATGKVKAPEGGWPD